MVKAFDIYNFQVNEINQTLSSSASDSSHSGLLWFEDGKIRRLTPIECERLQGFPDDWTKDISQSHRYTKMGNAVAIPIVEWIIRGLINNE